MKLKQIEKDEWQFEGEEEPTYGGKIYGESKLDYDRLVFHNALITIYNNPFEIIPLPEKGEESGKR